MPAAKRLFEQSFDSATKALNLWSRKPLELSEHAADSELDVEGSGERANDVGHVTFGRTCSAKQDLDDACGVLAIVLLSADVAEHEHRAGQSLLGVSHEPRYASGGAASVRAASPSPAGRELLPDRMYAPS